MLKKFFNRKEELGLSIVEVIVASSMMAIILSASAIALATGFSTAEFSSKRVQAAQFSQQVISIAKQAPFSQVVLGTNEGTIKQPPGVFQVSPQICNTQAARPAGAAIPTTAPANIVKTDGAYPGLVYCQKIIIRGVESGSGASVVEAASPGDYIVMTDITQLPAGTKMDSATASTSGGRDGAAAANATAPLNGFLPRRITVTVWWGENYEQKIVTSYVRTPTLAECMPSGIKEAASPSITSCNTGG